MARKAILTTGLLLVLTLPLGSGQELGNAIPSDALGTIGAPPDGTILLPDGGTVGADNGGCAIPEEATSYSDQEVLSESDWVLGTRLGDDGTSIPMATKTLTVSFAAGSGRRGFERDRSKYDLAGDASGSPEILPEGEAGMEIQDCSAGVCTVTVHVYANSTTTTRAGAGFWAFLPFFFQIGGSVSVEERVSSYTESKIACAGNMLIGLVFSGGTGPQTGFASILEENAKQHHDGCSYLNVPDVDDECWVLFEKPFELTASHPGNYTRFDVMNGGLFDVGSSALAALTASGTVCTPKVDVSSQTPGATGLSVPQYCLGNAGRWSTTFKAIDIKVDTDAAFALLQDAVQTAADQL